MLLVVLPILFDLVFAVDYCKLCENGTHTMCRYKEGPVDTCINYTKMWLTPGQKNYIVDIHNDIRNHVASGQESKGALGNQPEAADMFLLEWDEELASIAQRWVDQCISVNDPIQHDKCKRTERFEVGQNIVTAIVNEIDLPELSLLILNWYKQISNVIPSDIDDFTGIWKGGHLIGQYTQLVWAKTRFVGCALAAFKETLQNAQYNIRLVCNYGPAGNVIGQPVYQRGKPCSKCPQRVCDRVRPNLCTGINKSLIKKRKDMMVKYYNKATTLSNLIDVENPKAKFMLNTSQIIERAINLMVFGNMTLLNAEDLNYRNLTTIRNAKTLDNIKESNGTLKVSSLFSTIREKTKKYPPISQNYTSNMTTTTPKTTKNDNFTTSPDKTKTSGTFIYLNASTTTSPFKKLYNISQLMPNETLASNWSEQFSLKNSTRSAMLSAIKLIIEHFFKQRTVPETPEDALIVDLTKNKCEKEVKLTNGITLVQDCEGDATRVIYPGKQFSAQTPKRIKTFTINGDDIILSNNRHFRRAKGIWSNGHCRCSQFLRSHSNTLKMTYYLFVPTLLVSFSII